VTEPPPIVMLKDVRKRFLPSDSSSEVTVLNGVTLEVAPGESLAIIGPSGSGKSTLLQIIGSLDRPTSGEVLLDAKDITAMDEKELAGVRNREIGFVFQAHYLLPQCTVLENVLVPTLASRDTSNAQQLAERARALLDRVGLSHRLDHRPGQLSGGERQRVAVVRALINKPKLLLADEPTGALDRTSAHELGRLLVELNREQRVTVIVVTHALELARQMARVLELRDGVLVRSEQ